MGRTTTTGFSAAELAAAEWAKQQRDRNQEDSNVGRERKSHSIRRSHRSRRDRSGEDVRSSLSCERRRDKKRREGRSRSRDRGWSNRSDDVPRDPRNPLFAAYEQSEGQKSRRKDRPHGRGRSPEQRGKLRSEVEQERADPNERRIRSSLEDEWQHDAFIKRSPSPDRSRTKGRMWDTRKGAWRSKAGGVYLPPEEEEEEEASRPAQYVKPIPKDPSYQRYFHSSTEERESSPSPQERGSPVYE